MLMVSSRTPESLPPGTLPMRDRIPRRFHFVFGLRPQTEPFHLAHYLCLASCLGVNRPEAIHFHYEHEPWGEYWERIKPLLTLQRVLGERFRADARYTDPELARYSYAHHADFLRLEILVREGGVYADIDTLFVKPLAGELFSKPFVMGHERVDSTRSEARLGGSLCNAFIMSAPQAEFGRRWIGSMDAEFDGSWSRHSTFLPYRLSCEHPELIHVEPESSFFKLDWSRGGIADLFERNRADTQDVYSLHLWQHLWWESRRVDYSRFHAGRLTPAYVRHAETTFARLARRFLPEDLQASASRLCLEAATSWPAATARYSGARLRRGLLRLRGACS
jgi:hypothetical protein